VAPGAPMSPHKQNPPTEIELRVERAARKEGAEFVLPPPLAEPRLDFRVDRATALSYEVRAGEFIQVIDVQGQQCSDLQAFTMAQLEKGIERCLDVTTTRTLMGQGYPGPGLRAKYYDQDFQPLIELIQDNCMRHDAFRLACTAKYYEELGYPGHVNCSDNFNKALEPYQIAARRGWMAMNFFYNTGIDDFNQFYLDEPWSRPGDYVLLNALTDLVCVSSACPCDVDAANAWDPTDIHVRVYPPQDKFRRSIGFRKSPDSDADMTKETGFHARTSALTRNFTEYNGYWLANDYTNHGAIAEYWACREKCIALDLSALRKFEVVGPDAETLLQYCMTRNVRRLARGQVVYTAMCYDNGTMIDDGTLFRLGPDNFRWIGGNDFGGEWLRTKAVEKGLNVRVRSSTDQLHNISVQGPLSREVMKQIVWTPPAQANMEEMEWFRFSIGRIGDFDGIPIIASRTGYTGELGYEIFCHPDDAPAVWDAVWEAGQPHGMLPLGLEALDMLRIESGLIFANYEFDDQTDPFEAGIGFTVPLKSKDEDFIGRDALIRRKENPQRKLVGLELVGEEPAAHGDCVHIGRPQIGVVTSGTRSPILKKNIALCRIDIDYAEPGTEVEVGKLDGHIKRLPATVVAFPAFDPKKERPRS
ncbi:MAG: aminomethyltransferase family protein, partial [Alphaproteobacteria bacterium]|nr:aminomethyltransferase family protein [Alphaproteobacteria bacterium]